MVDEHVESICSLNLVFLAGEQFSSWFEKKKYIIFSNKMQCLPACNFGNTYRKFINKKCLWSTCRGL